MKRTPKPETPPKPETSGGLEILAHLRDDPWLWGLAGAFLGAVLLHPLWLLGLGAPNPALGHPGAHPGPYLVPALFLVALVVRLVPFVRSRGAPTRDVHIEDEDERRFWRNISLAFGLWLLLLVLRAALGIPEHGSTTDGPFAPRLGIDLGYALFYILLLIAAEQQVHRPVAWRPNAIERAIRWPALTLFVIGLTSYLVILPMGHPRGVEAGERLFEPAFVLFLSLDLFVVLRFGVLARVARSLRWRWIYGSFALAMAITLASDLLQAALGIGPEWVITTLGLPGIATLWLAPFLAFGTCFTLGRLPTSPTVDRPLRSSPRPAGSRLGDLAKAGGGATIAWALFFPTLHVLLYRSGSMEAGLRESREILVMVATGLLGLAAFLEQYYQQERVDRLWQEQVDTETRMRSSTHDLRLMVERQRSRAELERSEEKFASAFRASPDGLALADLDHGVIQDANRSFCRIFHLDPENAPGTDGRTLGLWSDTTAWDRLRRRLHREGSVRDVGNRMRSPRADDPEDSGRTEWIRLSFERIQAGPDPLLLIIARDLSEGELASWRLDEKADALVNAKGALVATDRRGRVVLWSTGAEALYGSAAADRIGRPFDPGTPDSADGDGKDRGDDGDAMTLRVPVVDRVGQPTASLFLDRRLPEGVGHALDRD